MPTTRPVIARKSHSTARVAKSLRLADRVRFRAINCDKATAALSLQARRPFVDGRTPFVRSVDDRSNPVELRMIWCQNRGIHGLQDTEPPVSPVRSYVSCIIPPRKDSPMAKLSLIPVSALMVCIGISVPAAAENDSERRSVVVRHNDLNLNNAEGRARLASRVKSAVRTVCNRSGGVSKSLDERAQALECERDAMADADIKIAELLHHNGARLADIGMMSIIAAH
jgi:UrcA family protein